MVTKTITLGPPQCFEDVSMSISVPTSVSKIIFAVLFVAGFVLGMPKHAFADQRDVVVAMTCDAADNSFLIRFGSVWNDAADGTMTDFNQANDIDPALKKLVAQPYSINPKNPSCVLANSMKIEVKPGYGKISHHGAGSEDPNRMITLILSGKPTYYAHAFYMGYGVGKFSISAIYYHDHKLYECAAQDGDDLYPDFPVLSGCQDVSLRLQEKGLQHDEITALALQHKKDALEAMLTPFCKDVRLMFSNPRGVESVFDYFDAQKNELIRNSKEHTSTRIQYLLPTAVDGKPITDPSQLAIEHAWSMDERALWTETIEYNVDLLNNGSKKKLIERNMMVRDGVSQILLSFLQGAEHEAEVKDVFKNGNFSNQEMIDIIDNHPKWKAMQINLGDNWGEYTGNTPYRIDGKTYIYYEPDTSDFKDPADIPSAILGQFTPAGELQPVCSYP